MSIGSSFIATVLLGSLSDRLGRKPIVAIAIVGMIISSTMQALVVYFNLNVYLFLVLLGIHGFAGGNPLTIGICYAIVTDTTPKKWLAWHMSFLEATIGFGRAVAFLGTNNWIHSTNCSFFYPSLLCIGASIATFLYLLLMTESIPHRNFAEEKQVNSLEVSFEHKNQDDSRILKLFNGLKIYFNPLYVGYSNWWRIWVLTAVICLGCMCVVGGIEILNFFLHNRPFEWPYDKIGYYGAVSSTLMGLILIIFVPLLVLLKVSYPLIILTGVISGIIGNTIVALVKTNWQMYIGMLLLTLYSGIIIFRFIFSAGVFLSTQQIIYPALRVLLERHVFVTDRGLFYLYFHQSFFKSFNNCFSTKSIHVLEPYAAYNYDGVAQLFQF